MNKRLLLATIMAFAVTACQEQSTLSGTRHLAPIPPATMSLMASKGMSKSDPILMRSFKKESEIEVWKRGTDGKYALLKTYPMCRWSGQLGPKIREGDRQAPEGFYTVTPGQMNPNSQLFLSFDLGYPNQFDRAHGRTGSYLMVHGECSSRGCFAMTNEGISEVYALAREAFAGGQRSFQFQSYPFRMTPENLAKHRLDSNIAFWRNLKEGSDYFEVTKEEPRVAVASMRYHFGPEPAAVAQKRAEDEQRVAELVGRGTPAVRTVYDDGGGHSSFHRTMVATAGGSNSDSPRGAFAFLDTRSSRQLGEVSRPEALAAGPREIPVETAAPKGKARSNTQAVASMPSAAPAAQNPAPAETKSIYQRALSFFGKSDAKPAPEQAGEPAAPIPPRRGASAVPASKPQVAERRAALGVMPGSQPVLPAGTTGFSRFY